MAFYYDQDDLGYEQGYDGLCLPKPAEALNKAVSFEGELVSSVKYECQMNLFGVPSSRRSPEPPSQAAVGTAAAESPSLSKTPSAAEKSWEASMKKLGFSDQDVANVRKFAPLLEPARSSWFGNRSESLDAFTNGLKLTGADLVKAIDGDVYGDLLKRAKEADDFLRACSYRGTDDKAPTAEELKARVFGSGERDPGGRPLGAEWVKGMELTKAAIELQLPSSKNIQDAAARARHDLQKRIPEGTASSPAEVNGVIAGYVAELSTSGTAAPQPATPQQPAGPPKGFDPKANPAKELAAMQRNGGAARAKTPAESPKTPETVGAGTAAPSQDTAGPKEQAAVAAMKQLGLDDQSIASVAGLAPLAFSDREGWFEKTVNDLQTILASSPDPKAFEESFNKYLGQDLFSRAQLANSVLESVNYRGPDAKKMSPQDIANRISSDGQTWVKAIELYASSIQHHMAQGKTPEKAVEALDVVLENNSVTPDRFDPALLPLFFPPAAAAAPQQTAQPQAVSQAPVPNIGGKSGSNQKTAAAADPAGGSAKAKGGALPPLPPPVKPDAKPPLPPTDPSTLQLEEALRNAQPFGVGPAYDEDPNKGVKPAEDAFKASMKNAGLPDALVNEILDAGPVGPQKIEWLQNTEAEVAKIIEQYPNDTDTQHAEISTFISKNLENRSINAQKALKKAGIDSQPFIKEVDPSTATKKLEVAVTALNYEISKNPKNPKAGADRAKIVLNSVGSLLPDEMNLAVQQLAQEDINAQRLAALPESERALSKKEIAAFLKMIQLPEDPKKRAALVAGLIQKIKNGEPGYTVQYLRERSAQAAVDAIRRSLAEMGISEADQQKYLAGIFPTSDVNIDPVSGQNRGFRVKTEDLGPDGVMLALDVAKQVVAQAAAFEQSKAKQAEAIAKQTGSDGQVSPAAIAGDPVTPQSSQSSQARKPLEVARDPKPGEDSQAKAPQTAPAAATAGSTPASPPAPGYVTDDPKTPVGPAAVPTVNTAASTATTAASSVSGVTASSGSKFVDDLKGKLTGLLKYTGEEANAILYASNIIDENGKPTADDSTLQRKADRLLQTFSTAEQALAAASGAGLWNLSSVENSMIRGLRGKIDQMAVHFMQIEASKLAGKLELGENTLLAYLSSNHALGAPANPSGAFKAISELKAASKNPALLNAIKDVYGKEKFFAADMSATELAMISAVYKAAVPEEPVDPKEKKDPAAPPKPDLQLEANKAIQANFAELSQKWEQEDKIWEGKISEFCQKIEQNADKEVAILKEMGQSWKETFERIAQIFAQTSQGLQQLANQLIAQSFAPRQQP